MLYVAVISGSDRGISSNIWPFSQHMTLHLCQESTGLVLTYWAIKFYYCHYEKQSPRKDHVNDNAVKRLIFACASHRLIAQQMSQNRLLHTYIQYITFCAIMIA